MRNKANLLILLTTILMGAALTLWLDSSSAPPVPQSEAQDSESSQTETVPDFSFTDLNGNHHSITDFRGKTVVINFWATWCAPCVIEFPKLLKLAKDNPDIILIALSSDSEDGKINSFLKKNASPTRNVLIARDEKKAITADIFNTFKLPESLIISPEGQIVKKIVGDTDWASQDIISLLKPQKN